MATLRELQAKKPRADVWVTQRLNGAILAKGMLIVALNEVRGHQPIAVIEFPDGIEHFLPENVLTALPKAAQPTLF